MTRVLYTGGTGRMGVVIRAGLAGEFEHVRLLARKDPENLHANEETVIGDLADQDAVMAACRHVDVVVHLGGIADEAPFDDILKANIVGTHNVFEAARVNGVRRVVYASSNHVTGCYPVTTEVGVDAPVRPDTYYGVSKVFGEALARMYHDKYDVEVVSLRIGSFRPEPENGRQLSTWLSHRDGVELFRRSIVADDVGFLVIYGVSANRRSWWENTEPAARLGFHPIDDAEQYGGRFPPDPDGNWQGGPFAEPGYQGGTW